MIEKLHSDRIRKWDSGYFKPKGKKQKRYIHKIARRNLDLDTFRKGVYNRVGVHWEWS